MLDIPGMDYYTKLFYSGIFSVVSWGQGCITGEAGLSYDGIERKLGCWEWSHFLPHRESLVQCAKNLAQSRNSKWERENKWEIGESWQHSNSWFYPLLIPNWFLVLSCPETQLNLCFSCGLDVHSFFIFCKITTSFSFSLCWFKVDFSHFQARVLADICCFQALSCGVWSTNLIAQKSFVPNPSQPHSLPLHKDVT